MERYQLLIVFLPARDAMFDRAVPLPAAPVALCLLPIRCDVSSWEPEQLRT